MGENSAQFHESQDVLAQATQERHRAIASLMEELEAVDWYDQRVDATTDETLKAILAHNRDEEKEHAAMALEWLRRNDPTWDRMLRTYLFTEEPITEVRRRRPTATSRSRRPPPPPRTPWASVPCRTRRPCDRRLPALELARSAPRADRGRGDPHAQELPGGPAPDRRERPARLGHSSYSLGRVEPVAALARASTPAAPGAAARRAAHALRGAVLVDRRRRPRRFDADWQSVVDGADKAALAEEKDAYGRPPAVASPAWRRRRPTKRWRSATTTPTTRYVAPAVVKLKAAGVQGTYALALGPVCYTGVIETTEDGGYPVFEHLKSILGGPVVWAPAVDGAVVVSLHGGDYELVIGQSSRSATARTRPTPSSCTSRSRSPWSS